MKWVSLLTVAVLILSARGVEAQIFQGKRSVALDVDVRSTSAKRQAGTTSFNALGDALETPVIVEFVETPLKDVVAFLSDQLGVPIVFDVKAMESEAIAVDTPVTHSIKGVPARVYFRDILFSDFDTLDIVRREGFLMISTKRRLDAMMEPRIYQAADLPGVDESNPDVDSAVELIKTMVEPSSWDENGGKGEIVHLKSVLIIRQTPRIHERIDELLRQTREALAASAAAK
jgi:BMFP domain-containing protein YqiC